MRVIKSPEERKQEILDGAIRVFAKKGYDKTSITDIANEVNISQGLCYRYYPSKEAVYEAAIDEYASYIVNQNKNKTNLEGLSLKEKIQLMSGKIDEYSSVEHDQGELYTLFHKEGNHRLHNELFLKVGQKLVPYIEKILEEAINKGEIKVSDPQAIAYFMVFGQIGILMDKSIKEEDKTERIQKCMLELLGF